VGPAEVQEHDESGHDARDLHVPVERCSRFISGAGQAGAAGYAQTGNRVDRTGGRSLMTRIRVVAGLLCLSGMLAACGGSPPPPPAATSKPVGAAAGADPPGAAAPEATPP